MVFLHNRRGLQIARSYLLLLVKINGKSRGAKPSRLCSTFFCAKSSPHYIVNYQHITTPSKNITKTLCQKIWLLKIFALTLHSQNDGAIAQLVEQRTENPCVPGSIPGGTTQDGREFSPVFFVAPG